MSQPPVYPPPSSVPATRDERTPFLPPHITRALFATLCAACPLIPIPFLDDLLLRHLRRRLLRAQLSTRGFVVSDHTVRRLYAAPSAPVGKRLAIWVLLYPVRALKSFVIRKLLRKILYIFSIQDAIERGSKTWQEFYLAERAFLLGHVPPEGPTPELNRALRALTTRPRTSPIRRAWTCTARKLPSPLSRLFRASPQEEPPAEAQVFGELWGPLHAFLLGEGPLTTRLDAELDAAITSQVGPFLSESTSNNNEAAETNTKTSATNSLNGQEPNQADPRS
jgi:hypothetical protein